MWNVEDLMDLENWNLKWRISRWTPHSPLPAWGSPFFGRGGGGGAAGSTVWQCFQPILILRIPFKITSNFTPIHVYPALRVLTRKEKKEMWEEKRKKRRKCVVLELIHLQPHSQNRILVPPTVFIFIISEEHTRLFLRWSPQLQELRDVLP